MPRQAMLVHAGIAMWALSLRHLSPGHFQVSRSPAVVPAALQELLRVLPAAALAAAPLLQPPAPHPSPPPSSPPQLPMSLLCFYQPLVAHCVALLMLQS